MNEHPKTLLRLIVAAPRPGKLGLEWNYADGTSESAPASVAAIHKVLADHGHTISVEALSRIAFCGHRLVLTLRQEERAQSSQSASRLN